MAAETRVRFSPLCDVARLSTPVYIGRKLTSSRLQKWPLAPSSVCPL